MTCDDEIATAYRDAIRARLPELIAMDVEAIASSMADMMAQRDNDDEAAVNTLTMIVFLLREATRWTFKRHHRGIPLPLPFSVAAVWRAPHCGGAPN